MHIKQNEPVCANNVNTQEVGSIEECEEDMTLNAISFEEGGVS